MGIPLIFVYEIASTRYSLRIIWTSCPLLISGITTRLNPFKGLLNLMGKDVSIEDVHAKPNVLLSATDLLLF
jgi:hypothetical protein